MNTRVKGIAAALISAAAVALGIISYLPDGEKTAEAPPLPIETLVPAEPAEPPQERDYRIASEKLEAGEFREAEELFEELGDYEDSTELAAVCRGELYDAACRMLYRCEFEAAAEEFERLGSLNNSENYLAYCRERIDLAGKPVEKTVLRDGMIAKTYDGAKMYVNGDAMIYVPDECDEDTAFFVFYPGGAAGEVYLPFQKVYDYVEKAEPNAVMYFCTTSGYCTYKGRNENVIDILKQIAVEKNIAVHNLVVCGASAGVYTAIHAASDYYTHAGLPVWKVVALDAAMEWEDPQKLSDEDLEIISKNGTQMLLFEQPGVRDEKEQVHDMVVHGCDVTIIECAEKKHNMIAYNSFKYGVFSYALGMCDESGLKEGEYTFVRLGE